MVTPHLDLDDRLAPQAAPGRGERRDLSRGDHPDDAVGRERADGGLRGHFEAHTLPGDTLGLLLEDVLRELIGFAHGSASYQRPWGSSTSDHAR